MTEENKEAKLRITVDNKSTEKVLELLEKERVEKEKQKDPEADLAEKKLQAYQKFKNPMFLEAPDKATLSAMLSNYISELAERANPTSKPSGSPLVPQQYGAKPEDLYTKKFLDSQQMVSELRRLSKEGTPQERADSEHYLNELWRKYVLDKRAMPTRSEPSVNPNSPESLTELGLVKKDGFLTPANPEDGDLGQLQKKWREERKRRMENQQ
jgi:hypothetical protein